MIDIKSTPINSVLKILLQDKTSKKNIIWATDTYAEYGEGFLDYEQISAGFLVYHADIIKPRIKKTLEAQLDRTKKRAEVFTPAWLCNKMNNYCDEEWFGRKNIFNKDKPTKGIELDNNMEEYAFDLNEFFATNESGKFLHDVEVDKFLDALTKQEKFSFSTDD